LETIIDKKVSGGSKQTKTVIYAPRAESMPKRNTEKK